MKITIDVRMLRTRKGRKFVSDLLRRGYMLSVGGVR